MYPEASMALLPFNNDDEAEDWNEEDTADALFDACEKKGQIFLKDRCSVANRWPRCPARDMKECHQWEGELQRLFPDATDASLALEALNKAAKATCLVRRTQGSLEREDFYSILAKEEGLAEATRERYRARAEKWNKGGLGTGVLMGIHYPRSGESPPMPLVITDYHVIMDEEEGEGAEVYFDYDKDEQRKGLTGTTMFKVRMVFKTRNEANRQEQNYTILALDYREEQLVFLQDHCLMDDSQDDGSCLIPGERSPVMMLSHPHGLAKRLSMGQIPAHESVPGPIHDLATCSGSAGGPVVFFGSKPAPANHTVTGFLHYCDGVAVNFQDIRRTVGEEAEHVAKYGRFVKCIAAIVIGLAIWFGRKLFRTGVEGAIAGTD